MLIVKCNLGSKEQAKGKGGHSFTHIHTHYAVRAVLVEGRGARLSDVFPGGHNYLCAEYVCISEPECTQASVCPCVCVCAHVRACQCVYKNYPHVVFRGFRSITIRKT